MTTFNQNNVFMLPTKRYPDGDKAEKKFSN